MVFCRSGIVASMALALTILAGCAEFPTGSPDPRVLFPNRAVPSGR